MLLCSKIGYKAIKYLSVYKDFVHFFFQRFFYFQIILYFCHKVLADRRDTTLLRHAHRISGTVWRLSNSQYVVSLHHDSKGKILHLHINANRIDIEGNTNNEYMIGKVCGYSVKKENSTYKSSELGHSRSTIRLTYPIRWTTFWWRRQLCQTMYFGQNWPMFNWWVKEETRYVKLSG